MTFHKPISPKKAQPSGRFLSIGDVAQETTLSEATINRLHRKNEFPPKRHLSERRVGWYESDIADWKAARACAASTGRPATTRKN